MRVGIGMISRGEIGLIVAGVGISSGVLTSDVYSTIVIMVVATTIITPIWLKIDYRKEEKGEANNSVQKNNSDNDNSDDVHVSNIDKKSIKKLDV